VADFDGDAVFGHEEAQEESCSVRADDDIRIGIDTHQIRHGVLNHLEYAEPALCSEGFRWIRTLLLHRWFDLIRKKRLIRC
jgi:hypothetical protein